MENFITWEIVEVGIAIFILLLMVFVFFYSLYLNHKKWKD